MFRIPSEGALYWTLMQYGEIMTLSKRRLTKMQIDTHDAAISLSHPSDQSLESVKGSKSRISRTSSTKIRSRDKIKLKKDDAILTKDEMGLDELEKRLAAIESLGRAAWLKAFMHLSSQLRIFHPPSRDEWNFAKLSIPSHDIVFNGPEQEQNLEGIKPNNFVHRPPLMRKKKKMQRKCVIGCTDIDCKSTV